MKKYWKDININRIKRFYVLLKCVRFYDEKAPAADRSQRSEVRGQKSELRSKNGLGLFNIEPNIDPICLHSVVSRKWSDWSRYPQSNAKSSQVSVSLFSPSESVSLLMKWASYRLFDQASLRLLQTDLEALLIWSVREYLSSEGQDLLS